MQKIVIYGYGKCGKAYEKYVKENELAQIVAIVDKKYDLKSNNESNVFISLDECKKREWDYIIITPLEYETEIRNDLLEKGFGEDKIKSVYSNDITGEKRSKDKYCISCNKALVDFMEVGVESEIFCKKRIIGGGVRKGRCPCCGASDRERFI